MKAMAKSKDHMPLPIIKDLNNIDEASLTQFAEIGGCFVKIPVTIFKMLSAIEQSSQEFFAQDDAVKRMSAAAEGGQEGYLDQREKGYPIERFINQGGEIKDGVFHHVTRKIHHVREYFRDEMLTV